MCQRSLVYFIKPWRLEAVSVWCSGHTLLHTQNTWGVQASTCERLNRHTGTRCTSEEPESRRQSSPWGPASSHRPLFLGGGHPGFTCLLLKVPTHWGERPLPPLKEAGISISRRPTSLGPTQVAQRRGQRWKHFGAGSLNACPPADASQMDLFLLARSFLYHFPFGCFPASAALSSLAPSGPPFMPSLHALIPFI